jgi:hypothetical protein
VAAWPEAARSPWAADDAPAARGRAAARSVLPLERRSALPRRSEPYCSAAVQCAGAAPEVPPEAVARRLAACLSARTAGQAREPAQPGALARQAAALQPEGPDAAGAPRAAPGAAALALQEVVAARVEGLLPEAEQAEVPRPEAVRDAVLRREVLDVQPAAPDARGVARPSAAAPWASLGVLPPAPLPAERFARAMRRLRAASP